MKHIFTLAELALLTGSGVDFSKEAAAPAERQKCLFGLCSRGILDPAGAGAFKAAPAVRGILEAIAAAGQVCLLNARSGLSAGCYMAGEACVLLIDVLRQPDSVALEYCLLEELPDKLRQAGLFPEGTDIVLDPEALNPPVSLTAVLKGEVRHRNSPGSAAFFELFEGSLGYYIALGGSSVILYSDDAFISWLSQEAAYPAGDRNDTVT